MPRYKLTIEYDGTKFVGWQRQLNDMSVQEAIETAIFNFSGEEAKTQTAGRTDAGVHATGQVAHFDLVRDWPALKVREALNFHLRKHLVAIIEVESVPDTFEARFSAKARHYEYHILNRRARPALDANKVWHCPSQLDHEAMHAAAQTILGLHDFTTFRSVECQANSPMRTLDQLDVTREGDMIIIKTHARSFLHHQVRSLTGSLKLVGAGKWPVTGLRDALEARERSRCGAMAPSCGLYLVHVDY